MSAGQGLVVGSGGVVHVLSDACDWSVQDDGSLVVFSSAEGRLKQEGQFAQGRWDYVVLRGRPFPAE